jgi:hypothetical protein
MEELLTAVLARVAIHLAEYLIDWVIQIVAAH